MLVSEVETDAVKLMSQFLKEVEDLRIWLRNGAKATNLPAWAMRARRYPMVTAVQKDPSTIKQDPDKAAQLLKRAGLSVIELQLTPAVSAKVAKATHSILGKIKVANVMLAPLTNPPTMEQRRKFPKGVLSTSSYVTDGTAEDDETHITTVNALWKLTLGEQPQWLPGVVHGLLQARFVNESITPTTPGVFAATAFWNPVDSPCSPAVTPFHGEAAGRPSYSVCLPVTSVVTPGAAIWIAVDPSRVSETAYFNAHLQVTGKVVRPYAAQGSGTVIPLSTIVKAGGKLQVAQQQCGDVVLTSPGLLHTVITDPGVLKLAGNFVTPHSLATLETWLHRWCNDRLNVTADDVVRLRWCWGVLVVPIR